MNGTQFEGAPGTFNIVLPLLKIDEEKRTITARFAQEEPDKAREIMDYATAKAAFQTWSGDYERRTNGLSKGNVRAMHRKDSASGKVTQIVFNDEDKAIDGMIKVVDDQDWKKALEGVYTGVSIGGGYANSWKDGDLKRYTPRISEISLVDDPCMPSARFVELQKINGAVEQLELRGAVHTFAEIWAPPTPSPPTFAALAKAAPKKPATFAEMKKVAPAGDEKPAQTSYLGAAARGAAYATGLNAAFRTHGAIQAGAGAARTAQLHMGASGQQAARIGRSVFGRTIMRRGGKAALIGAGIGPGARALGVL